MSNRYEFHSALSLEKLNWELRVLVRAHNSSYGKECPIHLKWKNGNEFTIRQTDISTDFGSRRTAQKTRWSVFWRAAYGSDKVWSFQDPLQGVILSDGAGGSLVRIRTFPWTRRIIVLFGVILLSCCVRLSVSSNSWEPLLVVLFLGTVLFVPALKPGNVENNWELLAFLEENLSGSPPEKE